MSVRISGDFLALDKRVTSLINRHASAIHDSFPDREYEIQARIAEEFDQLNGHRVRVELVVTSPERHQIIVREAKKRPQESIDAAFLSLKPKLRRLRVKRSRQLPQTAARATPAASV